MGVQVEAGEGVVRGSWWGDSCDMSGGALLLWHSERGAMVAMVLHSTNHLDGNHKEKREDFL